MMDDNVTEVIARRKRYSNTDGLHIEHCPTNRPSETFCHFTEDIFTPWKMFPMISWIFKAAGHE